MGIRDVFICLSKHIAEKICYFCQGFVVWLVFFKHSSREDWQLCAGKYEFRSLLPIKRLFRMSRKGTSQYKMD